jgi:hypothetical protein
VRTEQEVKRHEREACFCTIFAWPLVFLTTSVVREFVEYLVSVPTQKSRFAIPNPSTACDCYPSMIQSRTSFKATLFNQPWILSIGRDLQATGIGPRKCIGHWAERIYGNGRLFQAPGWPAWKENYRGAPPSSSRTDHQTSCPPHA